MRYLVTAKLKEGCRSALRRAIENRSLGRGSVAGGEYLRDMARAHARSTCRDGNGTGPWSCINCDCTEKLEGWLDKQGKPFTP